jgi:two-component system LytT family sensor kinase
MSQALLLAAAALLIVVVPGVVVWRVRQGRRDLGTPADRAAFRTLHTASQAAPARREGLARDPAGRAARPLRALLAVPAVALLDQVDVLAWSGPHEAHAVDVRRLALPVLSDGRPTVVGPDVVACDRPDCPIRYAVVAPLVVEDRVVGALAAFDAAAPAGLVRATDEVARWVSGQLELAELDASRARLAEAEVRALRAQISPHFIYNALTAIASYVRTDPEHARELLLEFADFTRYSFRRHGDFTTLAEELRSVDRYLTLERARFGDRLHVKVRVAPEVLPVVVPFLCLQPIVENAVRHGLEGKPGAGHITILAENEVSECRISVEDDGLGAEPAHLRAVLAGTADSDSIGVANVDERMRSVYGDEYGLVVETGPGLGTKVTLRFPKFRAGVHA